jgi:hypothetical protein
MNTLFWANVGSPRREANQRSEAARVVCLKGLWAIRRSPGCCRGLPVPCRLLAGSGILGT